ncbi:hypothetical protein LUZ63_006341 [Rhynchospora breviuscula]|uniref:NPH3 domain-containing protein n=1 Tax=Rhynchospora breviuscula TaxID=2022672 RepID=A0A9Q0HTF2_9POAL|nr:hypothetical protein LUZ63_006341 [Rhynchospora breviuscula]
MKYMKLGSKPDIFYTEEAIRSVLSEVPTDIIIHINNTKYHLHKFPLLLKCGLLQQICSSPSSPTDDRALPFSLSLDDIPGGQQSFELCAKFCYGISINISAHNFVPVILAARYLKMTESVCKGNLVNKLESFFESCILQGWRDSIEALQSAWQLSGWAENRIVQPCMDSIVEKILAHTSQVTWSYTYTRPGYTKKQHNSVPKDWWTEDISDLDLDLFRSIMYTVRSTKTQPPALIGEALHVYASKHLPDPLYTDGSRPEPEPEETLVKQRRILESIVTMLPPEPDSVTCRFLLRLLRVANYIGASSSTKAELIKQSGRQLHKASEKDLLIPSQFDPTTYDLGVTEAVLEGFLGQFRRRPSDPAEARQMGGAMERVATIFDAFLEIVARSNLDLSVSRFIDLAEALPEIARKQHDGLYRAIDTFLKEHAEVSKVERKQLCRLIDCRKLSPETRAEAISNDRMPLRTIVQLLFVEHERSAASNALNISRTVNQVARRSEQASRERGPQERGESTGLPAMSRSLSVSKANQVGKGG